MPNLKLNYSQNMQQQFRLSAQMIQSIELLRLPIEELCDRVYQEAEKNPAIEIVRDADLSIRNAPIQNATRFTNGSDTFQAFLENTQAHEESLQEHLLFQLSLLSLSEQEKSLGERIIQSLDNHGFFTATPNILLFPHETSESLDKMLSVVRSFDPLGIAFSNVQESLQFQAEVQGYCTTLAYEILKNHFAVLEKKRPPLITKYLNDKGLLCSLEEVEQALEFIRTLEPYPASEFNPVDSTVQYIIPDVIVRKKEENEIDSTEKTQNARFAIEFLKGSLPEIIISDVYSELLEKKNKSDENYQFVTEAVQGAKHFIQALSYRTNSIYRTLEIIVAKQYNFFAKGPGHLVPLRQKDVAVELDMHETTISRIANGKYLQCDWGIFELKYFFTNAVNNQEEKGSEKPNDSKESIKHQILLILKEHEKSGEKKLSDAKLVEKLQEVGITIARRTVAKYRGELNIESSFDRL